MPTYYWIAIAFIFIGLCFKFILDSKNSSPKLPTGLPYCKKPCLMSNPERILFEQILKVIPSNYFVYPQYNLDKVFYVKDIDNNSARTSLNNKIDRKSFDFLIVDQVNQSLILAIELDDLSHQRFDRKQRDSFINQVCQDAQLPLLHIINCEIDESNLREYIAEKVNIFNLS